MKKLLILLTMLLVVIACQPTSPVDPAGQEIQAPSADEQDNAIEDVAEEAEQDNSLEESDSGTGEDVVTVAEPEGTSEEAAEEVSLFHNCDVYPEKLRDCEKYKCEFDHMLTGDRLTREITGESNGKCTAIELMPNNGKMTCSFDREMRLAVSQYFKDVTTAEETGTSVDLVSGETKYTINGKEVENPLQEALLGGDCVITGYE